MIFARRQEFYGDNEVAFTIDVADKNVGVGTLDPQAALHIRKNIGAEVILDTIDDANVGAGIQFARQGTQFGYILGARGSGQEYVGIGYMADAYGRSGGNKNILTVDTKNQSVVVSGRNGDNNTFPTRDPFYGSLYTLDVDGTAKVQSLDIGGGGSRKTEWKVQGTKNGYAIMNTDRKVYDMWIRDSNGNVGIGKTGPYYKLDVDGIVRADSYRYNSDRRLKNQIAPLSQTLEKITSLQGVSFYWKDKSTSQGKNIGLIAQDVEQVFPEAVSTDDSGIKSVDYASLVAPLIEAVKEQQEEIEGLEERIQVLERSRE
jgi:hypothetical protein